MQARQGTLALAFALALTACASSPPENAGREPSRAAFAAAVADDARTHGASRRAIEVRALLLRDYGPPSVEPSPAPVVETSAAALARRIFRDEWAASLPPWLREGLAETVSARIALLLDRSGTESDRTIDGLLPGWVRARSPFPDAVLLASRSPGEAARFVGDAALVVAAATDGGEPRAVRELLEIPPTSPDEVRAFGVLAHDRAARFPSLERVVRAIEERPLALSTTALIEAATPPSGTAADDFPDAARDAGALEAKVRDLASSRNPERRRAAIFALGRMRPQLTAVRLWLAREDAPAVRATAVVALARFGVRDVAADLLELAKDSPVEEAAGRAAPLLSLFDELTGYVEPRRDEPAELSLPASLAAKSATRRPTYREIEHREAWLRSHDAFREMPK